MARARMVIATTTAVVVGVLVLASAAHAQQQSDVVAARDAYDRGAASYDAGEYALAAQQLSKADSIVANDVALELALKASVKANDPLLAMELATRADGRKSSGLLAARDEARSKLGARVGRVTVTCPQNATTSCSATLDDGRFPVAQQRWVLVGQHRVVITDSNNGRQAFQVRVDPNATVEVVGTNAIAATAPSPPRRDATTKVSTKNEGGGVRPIWFWIGLGASAILGGGTVASALDTKNKHEVFAKDPSLARSTAGSDAQLRTNLLGAGTAACVVVTAAMGLFFVNWGGSSPPATKDRDVRSANVAVP